MISFVCKLRPKPIHQIGSRPTRCQKETASASADLSLRPRMTAFTICRFCTHCAMYDYLIDWLIDCLFDWLIDYLIDWLFDWLTIWLIDYLIDWFTIWLIDWLIDYLIDWLFDWLTIWLIDWLIDYLIDWLIDWLIDRLIDWLIDRLIDCFRFVSGWAFVIRSSWWWTSTGQAGQRGRPTSPTTKSSSRVTCLCTRVARWYIFWNQKIPIWINFGGSCNGRRWYIVRPFWLLYGNLA
jgi:hypothetical protein